MAAISYTLGTLLGMTRDFIGDPSTSPTPRWTEVELRTKLNIAADWASRKSLCIRGERLENVTADTPYVTLDDAITRIDYVQWKDSAGEWIRLYEDEFDALYGESLTTGADTGDPKKFAVSGKSESDDAQALYLYPTPDTTLANGIRILCRLRAAALATAGAVGAGADDDKEYVGMPAAVAELLPEYVAWMVGHSDREFQQAQTDLMILLQRLREAAGMVSDRNAKRVKHRIAVSPYR